MRRILLTIMISAAMAATAQNISIRAVDIPAQTVFRAMMKKTGKNFVYSSDLLSGMKVTVDAKDKPLHKVLDEIFAGTDIEYKIKGLSLIHI